MSLGGVDPGFGGFDRRAASDNSLVARIFCASNFMRSSREGRFPSGPGGMESPGAEGCFSENVGTFGAFGIAVTKSKALSISALIEFDVKIEGTFAASPVGFSRGACAPGAREGGRIDGGREGTLRV